MKTLFTFLITLNILFSTFNDNLITNHKQFLNQVFETLEEHVANPEWLNDAKFLAFKNKMYAKTTLALQDEEFYEAFNQGRKNLSFTHFQLIRKTNTKTKQLANSNSPITWSPINKNTAYLKVSTFVTSGEPMINALQNIGTDTYKNLIIDLRGNSGGSLDAPIILGQFLTQNTIDAGYYLTRKWFENHNRLPTTSQVNEMAFLQDFTYKGIRKMFVNEAAFRTVIPGHNRPIYKGKVFVLIDQNTASACEPLIDLLQKENIATIVGETSYGAMLSGHSYPINKTFDVVVPIADYYTAQGLKIDKIGIKPDIETDPSTAKAYVLELIKQ